MANKTVYPVPGVSLPGIDAKEQSVDETWAAELVSTGAFRFTDYSDEAKQGLIHQEVRRVTDAQQSDAEASMAKLLAKQAKADKLPPEAIPNASPNPADPSDPRAIAGVDPKAIASAVEKGTGMPAKTPSGDDASGGMKVTR